MVLAFYMLILRPQKKRRQEMEQMQASISTDAQGVERAQKRPPARLS